MNHNTRLNLMINAYGLQYLLSNSSRFKVNRIILK